MIIKKSIKHLCNFRRIGAFGRRKYCCNHFKKCKGLKCLVRRKGCKFVGPTYTRTPSSQCKWKKIGKRQKRRRCCYFFNYCVNQQCNVSKKRCKFVGSTIKISKFKRCYWKQVEENGKYGRKRECCHFIKTKSLRGARITKKKCQLEGNMVQLSRTYYKRKVVCIKKHNRRTCCKKIFKCEIKENKHHECKFLKE